MALKIKISDKKIGRNRSQKDKASVRLNEYYKAAVQRVIVRGFNNPASLQNIGC